MFGIRARSLAVLLALLVSTPSWAENSNTGRTGTVTMSGKGIVSAIPDQAILRFGVVTLAQNTADALDENSSRVAAIMDVLDAAGVAPEDRGTSNLSIRRRFQTQEFNNGRREEEFLGVEVSNDLSITARDLDALGSLIRAVVGGGANDFRGLRFGVADPTALIALAREQAARQVRDEAEQYTQALGAKLGPILSIADEVETLQGPRGFDVPVFEAPIIVEDSGAVSVPLARGNVRFEAEVYVTWAIDQ